MKNLKIAFFGDSHDHEVLYHISYFTQKGYDVRFYSVKALPRYVSSPPNLRFKKLSTVNYPWTYFTFVGTAFHMLRHKPDIMHAFNLANYGVLSSLYCRLAGFKPMILTAKGQDVFHDAKTHKGWAIKHMIPIGALFTSSDEMAVQEMVKMGASIKKVRVIDPKREDMLQQLEQDYLELTAFKRVMLAARQENKDQK
ncbi:MAG: hypothetical protein FWF37_01295 [Chloroflexi bacterium]|nr:hypothetical protein [Chloroflexota bacterium]